MSCNEVEARLVDAIDDRLDPAAAVRFHAHLEGCVACRERGLLWRALVPGLRSAVPAGPDAMAVRRMQLEVERQLVARPAPPVPVPRWKRSWAPALGLAALAAIAVLWLRPGSRPSPAVPVGYAALTNTRGDVAIGDRPATTAARIPAGAPIVLRAGSVAEIALDRGSTLSVEGPAQLALEGTRGDVAVRLAHGRVRAEVAHRREGEAFAVITRDLRVEVRGTKFSVEVGPQGSQVEVIEGRVAVLRADHPTRFVSAGESFTSMEPDAEERPLAPPPASHASPCGEIERACQATARSVRAAMRDGGSERALRLIADGNRDAREPRACGTGLGACQDELRYLHAEALNQTGRLDDAITAYHALDRKGEPAAMRQNALYAAAQIARRQGRTADARADYERALAVAPRGALREEALVGAMETAALAGDSARAQALAAKYLELFPRGLAAKTAGRLSGDGAPP